MMELPLIVAPGQNAGGTQHHIAREEEKKKHRNRRPESRKKQYAEFRDMRHGPVESQGRASRKRNLRRLRPVADIRLNGKSNVLRKPRCRTVLLRSGSAGFNWRADRN